MSVFRKAVTKELLQITTLQAGIFVLKSVFTPPPQGSLRPPSHCVAGLAHYAMINMLQPYLTFALFGAAIATYSLSRELKSVGDEANAPPPTKRQRAHGMLALLLSVATTAIAMASTIYTLEASVSLISCFSGTAKACLYISSFGLVSFCVWTYSKLGRAILWAL